MIKIQNSEVRFDKIFPEQILFNYAYAVSETHS